MSKRDKNGARPKRALPGNSRVLSVFLGQALARGERMSAAEWVLGSEEEAYAVQGGLIDLFGWYEHDYEPEYWKSGGPSRDARLTHAPLPPDRARQYQGQMLDFSDLALHKPGAEAEIAVRFGRPVAGWEAKTLTPAGLNSLIHSFAVSIELVSSRWEEGFDAPPLLRLADLQSHGGLALGEWQPWLPGRDWAQQACTLQVNDEPPLSATGAHPLGDPAWGLIAFLQHVTRDGDVLPAGSVVTTGAWIVRQGLQAGDRVAVAFDGIGAVELRV
ncbi:fumarylacetoacetate hydrolase family protein [Pelomonas sp. KK5]|uniref:fumarylacetoacetate hydrolase family protein n=1 Tax=Pelomonas sp. KK5 TaxID=1855730 RepID=UPI0009F8E001|nr:fumarylacetoacetate hydrolase family protein [Pelomonas sp. KK5]